MNRRDFLANLRNLCLAYGIHGIFNDYAFASGGQPQRLINFVVKYTGGTTVRDGIGQWTYSNTLQPLSSFQTDLLIPLGLNAQFTAPMNSHASPQVSALSGSMTGFVLRETYYPEGNLKNYSTGNGKSIDVLIGEKLQKDYNTKIPYLSLTNNNTGQLAPTHKSSSWGNGGTVIQSIDNIRDLASTLKTHINCQPLAVTDYKRRLAALEYVKANNQIFSSKYLINKDNFEKIKEQTIKNIDRTSIGLSNTTPRKDIVCNQLETYQNLKITDSFRGGSSFTKKMDYMYDLAIIALQENITRSITFNLYTTTTHATSHFIGDAAMEQNYYAASKEHQTSIASFLRKLQAAGLYDGSLIFCNAGSCMSNNVHNYENIAAYIINGGASGVRGSARSRKPMGSVLLDILHKFGVTYSNYGGRDHIYGLATKGNYI